MESLQRLSDETTVRSRKGIANHFTCIIPLVSLEILPFNASMAPIRNYGRASRTCVRTPSHRKQQSARRRFLAIEFCVWQLAGKKFLDPAPTRLSVRPTIAFLYRLAKICFRMQGRFDRLAPGSGSKIVGKVSAPPTNSEGWLLHFPICDLAECWELLRETSCLRTRSINVSLADGWLLSTHSSEEVERTFAAISYRTVCQRTLIGLIPEVAKRSRLET